MLREGVVINLIVGHPCRTRWGEVVGEKRFSEHFLNARISTGILFVGFWAVGDEHRGRLKTLGMGNLSWAMA